jgi:transcriptional regulator with XRE-family HTH domain
MKQQEMSAEQQTLLIEIGKKIKELRTNKKFTYEKMSEEIGIARNTYLLLEHGRINFQLSTLQLVLKYHKISFSKFFRDVESKL